MKIIEIKKDWKKYKAVIFDVDGTIYDLSKMHKYIFFAMLKYYLFHPWLVWEVLVVYIFRKEREQLALSGANNIVERQYLEVAKKIKIEKSKVFEIINFWIFEKPLQYIDRCLNFKIKNLIDELSSLGVLVIYFSDYDPEPKVRRLGLKYDYFFNASSKQIDALKPSPKGVEYILQQLSLRAEDCLMIGDRQDKDGAAAIAAGLEYFIVN